MKNMKCKGKGSTLLEKNVVYLSQMLEISQCAITSQELVENILKYC